MPERRIVVDTREQKPYRFSGLSHYRATLPTGDYSLEGLEDRIAIERKSKSDAYGCVGRGRGRFTRCLARLAAMDRGIIVIESSLEDFAVPPPRTKVNAASAVGSYLSWSVQYGIPVIWACNRVLAERVVVRVLEAFEKHCTKKGG